MTQLLAVCGRCRSVFATNNAIEAGEGSQITMTSMRVGPCPNCGGMGRVPDGQYMSTRGAFRLLRDFDPVQLVNIVRLLQNHATVDEVASAARESSPELAAVVEQNRVNWELWAPILLSIILFILGPPYAKLFEKESPSPAVMHIIEEQTGGDGQKPSHNSRNAQPRNEKCACGSGTKYKNCHGRWLPVEHSGGS